MLAPMLMLQIKMARHHSSFQLGLDIRNLRKSWSMVALILMRKPTLTRHHFTWRLFMDIQELL
ncbi:MAG: hypothetical protein TE42_01040 [Candidatus Synechococcus spongiarum SP3]|uniref:Uncharacterized protein n=1 Tax=Candidatus Synechococcus spongiarum SP3 TaxID=1604020 RepID=A0A0G2J5L6_9SYNE|nr:MAG: hypothetical protein TE42_01040 [Candidatus Synechococcus spongiarum SP3]